MGVKWTQKQQKVIDTRGKNLLVSAAAGSGKTAVLVERIITMITDSKNPIDIDKLLVVTFTNAAAAEMRERILDAIQKKSEQDPDIEHLQKQQTYIHNAHITTIHSFCLNVIREHFNEIEIDPGFRVADEGELTLLKSDIICELLEEYYEEASDEFCEFIETYASGKGDDTIEELIAKLYSFSMSYPWPDQWIDFCGNNYDLTQGEILNADWMKYLLETIDAILLDYMQTTNNAIALCETTEGPYMYVDALQDDLAMLQTIHSTKEFNKRVELFSNMKFTTLSRKQDENVSLHKKEEVKTIRKKVKDGLASVGDGYYFQTIDKMAEDIKNSAKPTKMLLALVKEFYVRFSQAKREKNIIDFNDIEHLAFQILVKTNEEGKPVPTLAAQELAQYYEEIIIDEYQDSNLLQELILNSVSKEQFGNPNIFMVGDVKQSIYKFRMAKPELFVQKYDTYSLLDSDSYQRITLDMNFRSRDHVLKSINFIFEQIMARYLGDIEYDEENALYTGADYPELPQAQLGDTEVMLIDGFENNGKELEAHAIANRIKELVDIENGQMIVDKKTNTYRRAKYSDIVILYRSLAGWAQEVEEILMGEGIPCYSESKQGYFNALEIKILLSLLSIIDNPVQDIELAAVLKSPIVGLTSADLAQIKIENPTDSFYSATTAYSQNGKDEALREKLSQFLIKLEKYRTMATYMSIYELLTFVLNDTGYYLYVTAMPSGERRRANIDMLKEKAIAFEKTSYKGVFNFIRYIEKLKKYNVDFAQASIISENDNTVRIMSIHKSKGLEFPIVILAGIGKKFNNQDITSKIILHSEFGIGVDYIDTNLRIKEQTLMKKSIALKLKLENLGEELRVLYVALTRAKEKLIIVGNAKNIEKKMQKWMSERYATSTKLAFETLINSGNYMDWICLALIRHSSIAHLYKQMNIPVNFSNPLYDKEANFVVKWINAEEIAYETIKDTIRKEELKENLLHWKTDYVYDETVKEELKSRVSYVYPNHSNREIHTKMSVSQIKKLSQSMDEEYSVNVLGGESTIMQEIVPAFIAQNEVMDSASKGSAYHRILELLDFTIPLEEKSIEDYITLLVSQGKITQKAAATVDCSVILQFLKSQIGQRMIAAGNENKLYREQQYVMGINASEINEKYANDEMVLIQGIIDAYFEEEELVIVDYKTDKVHSGKQLVDRYKVQLEYYEKALTQITGKRVKEKIIYSLHLGNEVLVK